MAIEDMNAEHMEVSGEPLKIEKTATIVEIAPENARVEPDTETAPEFDSCLPCEPGSEEWSK